MEYRIEHDSMGEMKVPADRLWAAQTQRSHENFEIGVGIETMPAEIIHAFGILKKAAALANHQLKPEKMTDEKTDVITRACDEVISGQLNGHFPLVVWQTGSGTQSNMNANEVVANRANQLAGQKLVHPNDDVNMSQSSNDTFPTAMHISAVIAIEDKLLPAIDHLVATFKKLEAENEGIVKSGRTHLQDATPIKFSQEISGWRSSLERDAEVSDLLRRSDAARERFRQMFPLDGVEQSALEDYRKEWMARYVYNSNAIEGSTLTLEDTELVLEGEFVPTDSPARYIFAARGVADGMAYAERFAEEERTLSVEMIQKLHEVTALDMQPALRGRFRPYGYQARITATRVKTADPLEIYEDMEALVDAVNGSKDHPILKAAGFHAMFENIHPFTDGNGRTGRQILNLMLMAAGYRPVAIKHDAGRSYGKSLEAWQVDGDPKPFISQLVQCVDQEERAVAEIVGRLRENPFSENAIDGIGLEDGPARGRSL